MSGTALRNPARWLLTLVALVVVPIVSRAEEGGLTGFQRTGTLDGLAGKGLIATFPPGEKWTLQFDARDAIEGETELVLDAQLSLAFLEEADKLGLWAHVQVELNERGRAVRPIERLVVVNATRKARPRIREGTLRDETPRKEPDREGAPDKAKLPDGIDDDSVQRDENQPPQASAGTYVVFGPITKARGLLLTINRIDMRVAPETEARIYLTDRQQIQGLLQPGDPLEVRGRTRQRLHVFAKHIRATPDRIIGAELEKKRPDPLARNEDRPPKAGAPANAKPPRGDGPFKPAGEATPEDDPFGVGAEVPASTTGPAAPRKVRVLKVN